MIGSGALRMPLEGPFDARDDLRKSRVELWDGRSSIKGKENTVTVDHESQEKNLTKTRVEHDLLGELKIPDDCYYGVQTLRAVSNYQITGIPIGHYPALVKAFAYVKRAAAATNGKLGTLDQKMADAICETCDEILEGKFHDQFVVDMVQGGAGTSTNMNANEVIANRTLERMGHPKGHYEIVHPNDHINMSQSTNDSYPTSCKLAIILREQELISEMQAFVNSLQTKAKECRDIVKMGRTQLQDAVPMTLGQEFQSWANTVEADIETFEKHRANLLKCNLGGTAIGTGICANPDFGVKCVAELARITGHEFCLASDLIQASSCVDGFMSFSGTLRRTAVKISKICSDLRLLSSGPRCGIGEIQLPAMAPGSSIMPGKVNPIIPEVVNQVAFCVCGNDVTVTMAAEHGQLQLNVFEPVIVFSIFKSIDMLTRAFNALRTRCIDGIVGVQDRCENLVNNSVGIVTALLPEIGYKKASHCAKAALLKKKAIADVVLEMGYLSEGRLKEVMKPANMVGKVFITSCPIDEDGPEETMQASSARAENGTAALQRNILRRSVVIDVIAGDVHAAADQKEGSNI